MQGEKGGKQGPWAVQGPGVAAPTPLGPSWPVVRKGHSCFFPSRGAPGGPPTGASPAPAWRSSARAQAHGTMTA